MPRPMHVTASLDQATLNSMTMEEVLTYFSLHGEPVATELLSQLDRNSTPTKAER